MWVRNNLGPKKNWEGKQLRKKQYLEYEKNVGKKKNLVRKNGYEKKFGTNKFGYEKKLGYEQKWV